MRELLTPARQLEGGSPALALGLTVGAQMHYIFWTHPHSFLATRQIYGTSRHRNTGLPNSISLKGWWKPDRPSKNLDVSSKRLLPSFSTSNPPAGLAGLPPAGKKYILSLCIFSQATAATQFLATDILHLRLASLFLFYQSFSRPRTHFLHVWFKWYYTLAYLKAPEVSLTARIKFHFLKNYNKLDGLKQ